MKAFQNYILTISILLVIAPQQSLLASAKDANVAFYQPAPQSMVPADQLEVIVEFDVPIDPESIDSRSFSIFGRWTGVCQGNYILENNNQRIRFIPTTSISAGEWITVSLSKQIQTASGENLSQGFAWNFWTTSAPAKLDLNKTSTVAVRNPGEGHIRTYGTYAGDLNGDGYHDFTVPNEEASDVRVFLNDGTGSYSTFSTFTLPNNSVPSTNEGADFDGDGNLDFAVGNIASGSASVFMGDGAGGFAPPATYSTGGGTRGLCVLDLNFDGAPDIVTANRNGSSLSLLLNNGNGTFRQSIPLESGVNGETSCTTADFNNDGIMDVAVGGFFSHEMAILLGDGNGNLIPSFKTDARGVGWMLAAGDMDNDGNVDVVSANANQHQFALLLGNGDGTMQPAEVYSTGFDSFPIAIDVGDLDGDGDLEVVTSNFRSANWTIFENDGTGKFLSPRILLTTAAGSCAVLHDRDRDGDLDITGIDELDDTITLFENEIVVGIDEPPILRSFELLQSYPNPFFKSNSSAIITSDMISIPFTLTQPSDIKIEILNIKGQTVSTTLSANLPPGRHTSTLAPQTLPAGVYFYRLTSGQHSITRKFLLFP